MSDTRPISFVPPAVLDLSARGGCGPSPGNVVAVFAALRLAHTQRSAPAPGPLSRPTLCHPTRETVSWSFHSSVPSASADAMLAVAVAITPESQRTWTTGGVLVDNMGTKPNNHDDSDVRCGYSARDSRVFHTLCSGVNPLEQVI